VAREKRIGKQHAQSGEGMADRRLAHVQSQRRARDLPLGKQRIEHHQEIKVNGPQIIHSVHNIYDNMNFK
jgi:hypothetical protein